MKAFIYALYALMVLCLGAPFGIMTAYAAEPAKNTAAVKEPTAQTAHPSATFEGTLYDAISQTPQLSSFAAALNRTGLAEDLKGKGPFSLYVPDNNAFSKLPENMFDNLMASSDHALLKALLSRYIVPGNVLSASVPKSGLPLTPMNGQAALLKNTPEGIVFNSSLLTTLDVQTKNGVLNIINSINPQPPGPPVPLAKTETPPASAKADSSAKPADEKPTPPSQPH